MSDDLLDVHVECYAGHRGEQTPRVVHLGDRAIEVAVLLDQWLAPDHRYFKFADPGGDIFIVRHDEMSGRWELTLFRRGGADDSAVDGGE